MQLNRYVATSGLCSRRSAVTLITAGAISVNGVTVRQPGYRVGEADAVTFKGKPLVAQRFSYLLLSKPKGYVCTTSDELGRPTVLDLCSGRTMRGVRLYPIGRLDTDSTGLLILTNDGSLAHRLAHPSFEIIKKYRVQLHMPLRAEDGELLCAGVELADGISRFDSLRPLSSNGMVVEVRLHSGKNRIIRRTFARLGYHVRELRRVTYAGITDRRLRDGEWRHLTSDEVTYLRQEADQEEITF